MPTMPSPEHRDLVHTLSSEVRGDVDDSTRRRAEYSSDASNYRVVPQVVVFPRDTDDVLAALSVSRDSGTPLTSRGGGTSVAGNAIGSGIVLDFSRHLNHVLEIDADARTARVQPGTVLATLQSAAQPHGLRFGPDPSTWSRCTVGGMIGNNACGAHSLQFGKTADNVKSLDVIDGLGRRFTAANDPTIVDGLPALVSSNLATIRTELGRFGRQVSGYSLEHLLPEHGHNLARSLVGTEGSLVTLLEATVDLVAEPQHPLLVALGYPDMVTAADAVPALLAHHPTAIEGLDARIVDAVSRARGARAVAALPAGAGWLLVEVTGDDPAETLQRANNLAADAAAIESRVITDAVAAKQLWRIREDGAGLAGRTASGTQAWPGFEDAAVPPERLGAYLRDFDALLADYNIQGMPYGHFGDGCVHVRLEIPLATDGAVLRAFVDDAASLVVSHGGSLSGEHGDGRARSELLPRMYSPAAIDLFGQFKRLFDPNNLMNPGIVVDPAPVDAALRRPAALPLIKVNGFAFSDDDGDLTTASHRCVGVGKCRADNSASHGVMCPSFLATGDEKDSTRGRARVLQEMANGSLVSGGVNSPEVHDALDLCLSCKACASDCPAGVDMATLKAEVLHRRYEGKLRPRSHYLLGQLPRWARLISPIAPLANAALRVPLVRRIALWAGGMDARRTFPAFARHPFRSSSEARALRAAPPAEAATAGRETPATAAAETADRHSAPRPQVLLWADSFTDNFSPDIARATIRVLDAAGYEILLPERDVCCGLTWITTGQLAGARQKLTDLVSEFSGYVDRGIPIIGIEPSCTAVLRSDLTELLPNDPAAAAVARSTFTLSELLTAPAPLGPANWQPPILSDHTFVVQPHCHQHAVMGFDADRALLAATGATVTEISGCCGLAGNFGMEKGHYDVSVAVAENGILPALREAASDSTLIADGFSCRTQASQLANTEGKHLAEVLAAALPER
ncbi:FAD-binding oxidoreductase [Salinibacterium sp. NSLL150]|uniref:FAD-binding and (Fe-S)-binding domain-containing protein n=1 Tax=unclassified Salinibacterium TaxID=2632331 RepID=UPI0018CE8C57|nr:MULTISPECIES: FAD-binding and (Fe-S)-binding domain-containing protein [unclassified Salinibacterium]MBH0098672.1 FAD-binding oxidoreductase [Salinibacterium sp. NSLL35]MBH0101427.1 FAD-binding oxidoreductase [Salinibacterium sp. NSLL150]MBH0104186.1 FAD-binding oxidoreductase [Salinibacterium sp. NSLL16]MBH0106947.1 FAD-binding oxidoreductase [Salinibacterium sp. NSLL17]